MKANDVKFLNKLYKLIADTPIDEFEKIIGSAIHLGIKGDVFLRYFVDTAITLKSNLNTTHSTPNAENFQEPYD